MTVTYTREVATSHGFSCFLRLLARWRGSIYKLVYTELIIYLILYYALLLLYNCALNEDGREVFKELVEYCRDSTSLIPLSFVLGFYVSIVMTRWWSQYCSIPFPDSIAVFVSATIHGQDERGRIMRRTIMRYVCLCVTMMFTYISPKVKKRFPTFDHLVAAGLLDENEKVIIENLIKIQPKYPKHWMPLVWAASIVTRARKENRIRDDFAVKTILDEINQFRVKCGTLINYDYISIPLVYTQVVTLAVYTYFLASLMAHQVVDTKAKSKFSCYFPLFTLLQFFFYMGWLKVAETLINPFGDDDDDFDLNWMVDRNIQISYLIVDEMHHEHPKLIKDQYWDEIMPDLPYTEETKHLGQLYPVESTANIFAKVNEAGDDGFGSRPKLNGSMLSLKPAGRARRPSFMSHLQALLRSNSQESENLDVLERLPRNVVEEVIEEVDEQLTLMTNKEPKKATVFDVFPQQKQVDAPSDPAPAMMHLEGEKEHLIRIKENLTNFLQKKEESD